MQPAGNARCVSWRLARFTEWEPLLNLSTTGVAPWHDLVGPSVVRVPSWLPPPLSLVGEYLMFFASHWGRALRVATAPKPSGPWAIFPHDVLTLKDVPHCRGHLASPDVHVDDAERKLVVYFHCHPAGQGGKQWTFVADSPTGFTFRPVQPVVPIRDFYFRRFVANGTVFGIAKQENDGGVMYRSVNGGATFTKLPGLLPRMRHAAPLVRGGQVHLFYTSIGDAPEHIKHAVLWPDGDAAGAAAGSTAAWIPRGEASFVFPVTPTEGALIAPRPSTPGPAFGRSHALRDPAVLLDKGRLYLYFTVAGENGISGGELTCQHAPITTAAGGLATSGALQLVLHNSTRAFGAFHGCTLPSDWRTWRRLAESGVAGERQQPAQPPAMRSRWNREHTSSFFHRSNCNTRISEHTPLRRLRPE